MSLLNLMLALVFVSGLPLIQRAGVTGQELNARNVIRELRDHRWEGPNPSAIPLQWDLRLTEPMRKILKIGPPAQQDLIDNITDPSIKDQIIILLGGVADERAIAPIINAMVAQRELKSTRNSEQINLAANIALTNITVADVIWHYGGGVVHVEPPRGSKDRWMKWWKKNRNFMVKTVNQSRNYSNYPNYGIYKQP